MDKTQQLFDKRNEMVEKLEELTREELRELVEIENELSDKGFDVESHEELWINS